MGSDRDCSRLTGNPEVSDAFIPTSGLPTTREVARSLNTSA